MIESILLVDDENLFHLVFEDACSLLDITLNLESIDSADEAARLFSICDLALVLANSKRISC